MEGLVEDQIAAAIEAIQQVVPERETLGTYLYGSAVAGGLRPDSDLDLFVVAERRLRPPEKRSLIDLLRPVSTISARPQLWRPLELTIATHSEIHPWRYPARMDFQYGEWLSEQDLTAMIEAAPALSPDLAIVIAMVIRSGEPLGGPTPGQLLDPIPEHDLRRAMTDELPLLLADLDSDTRNVVLTLARIWVTLVTGKFLSKADAATWAGERLTAVHRPTLAHARTLYINGGFGPWDDHGAVESAVASIVQQIEQLST